MMPKTMTRKMRMKKLLEDSSIRESIHSIEYLSDVSP
jgi:hypothetical protein